MNLHRLAILPHATKPRLFLPACQIRQSPSHLILSVFFISSLSKLAWSDMRWLDGSFDLNFDLAVTLGLSMHAFQATPVLCTMVIMLS